MHYLAHSLQSSLQTRNIQASHLNMQILPKKVQTQMQKLHKDKHLKHNHPHLHWSISTTAFPHSPATATLFAWRKVILFAVLYGYASIYTLEKMINLVHLNLPFDYYN